MKGRKSGLFVNFGQFPCYWIRILIPNTDPCGYLDLDPQHRGRILSVPLDGGETTLETDLQDKGSYEGVVRLLLEVKTPDILHKLEEERGTGGGSGTAEATPQKLLGVRERAELRHLKNKILLLYSVLRNRNRRNRNLLTSGKP